jgi:hypothetical protein
MPPATKQPQTYALDHVATGIVKKSTYQQTLSMMSLTADNTRIFKEVQIRI